VALGGGLRTARLKRDVERLLSGNATGSNGSKSDNRPLDCKNKKGFLTEPFDFMVGARGFEPPTTCTPFGSREKDSFINQCLAMLAIIALKSHEVS
jgi:hypothetical protein